MPSEFSLSNIVPAEDITFKDDRFGGDGTVHRCRSRAEMDAHDLAKLHKVQADMRLNLTITQTGKSSKGVTVEQAANNLDRAVHQFIVMLIPDMPADRVKAIPTQVWYQFMQWWREQQAKPVHQADDQGEAEGSQETQPTKRARRSRASRPVTA
jgi:hypothetical protein